MKTIAALAVTLLTLATLPLSAQKEEARWKREFKSDLLVSGVGVNLSKPDFGRFQLTNGRWVGADVLYSFINVNFSQGSYLLDPAADGVLFPSLNTDNWNEIRASRFNMGINLPLPFLAIGSYQGPNRVLRLSSFIRANAGVHRFFTTGTSRPERSFSAEFAPGVRLRIPYASVDLAMSITKIGGDFASGTATAFRGSNSLQVYPSLTLRFDGLFDGMQKGITYSDGATFSGTRSESKRRYTDVSGQRMEETTVTYTGKVNPVRVALLDIGTYGGLGVKVARSGMRNRNYLDPGTLVGLSILFRNGIMVGGFNVEGGRIGHGSELETWKDGHRRQLKTTATYGMGSLYTVNFYGDFGVGINNLFYAAMGTVVADDVSTPFSAISMGVSFGAHMVGGQEFNHPEEALARYDATTEKATHFTDPRESKGGLMGGYFFSWDVGNTSFKAQWYRYRRAPMANGLMFSVAWRFGGSAAR